MCHNDMFLNNIGSKKTHALDFLVKSKRLIQEASLRKKKFNFFFHGEFFMPFTPLHIASYNNYRDHSRKIILTFIH